jgi:hypothetical protein
MRGDASDALGAANASAMHAHAHNASAMQRESFIAATAPR